MMPDPDLWSQYKAYLEAGEPGLTDDEWNLACLSWEEWKREFD